ncbi:hypothetical protein [Hydromonas duriensis]|uniref:Uncharacterized protein n=1 Tax=Hydromonas duriensis TaxID=1527608 RepID=A0A4R6Y8X9_9BURK|nr:hypothetical protein [Hydromonas duriensis]TDR31858.1 hypothetical protein DFR44_10775 [Hydromonas duriensis]
MSAFKKQGSQKGFVIVVVLVTLLILTGVVGSLLQNQSLSLKETSNILAAAHNEQRSHGIHRACLAQLRRDLQGMNLKPATRSISWVQGGMNRMSTQVNGVVAQCMLDVVTLPAIGQQEWLPVLRLTTKSGGYTEISELRYPSCIKTNCVYANVNIELLNSNQQLQTVSPTFLLGGQVQVAWHR